MKKFVILFLFYGFVLQGQTKVSVDSLVQVVNNSKATDTAKVKALNALVTHYMYLNKDSTLYFSKKLFTYSEDHNFNYGRYSANYSKAFYFFTTSSFDSVIYHLDKALYYATEMDTPDLMGEVHSKLSGVYGMLNQKEKALFHASETLTLATQNKDWIGVGYASLNLGNIHFYSEEYDLAIRDFQKVDSILSIHKPLDISLGNALSNIGLIFLNQQQYGKAEEYFERAYLIFDEMAYENGVQVVKAHVGKMHTMQNKFEDAVKELSESLEYFKKIGSTFKIAENYTLLGKAFYEINEKEKAFSALAEAKLLKESVKDTIGVLENLTTTGELRLRNNEPRKSLTIATEALLLAKKVPSLISQKNALLLIAQSHAALKNYEQSYLNYQEYSIVKDSLLKVQNLTEVQELEAKYQTDKKEQEITLLTTQKELLSKQKENQRNLLLGGLGVTTLTGIFLFFLYRNRQKTHRKLQELDTAKSNFFANISHEFRTPLTLISAPIEKKLEDDTLSAEDRTDLEMVRRNSKRLLNLVDQLLDLAKLESGNLVLKVREGDLNLLLKSLASSFEHQAATHNNLFSVSLSVPERGWYDADALEKIVVNLLSNAFKYVTQNGKVSFTGEIRNEQLVLQVENDGEIAGNNSIDEVFKRFFQKEEHREGVGIGLALVKELVSLHHGGITVKNTPQKTVLFEVVLPVSRNEFSEAEISVDTEKRPGMVIPSIENDTLVKETVTSIPEEDAPILLVVEDNMDVRAFIQSVFKKEYQVVEAVDGEEGIAKAEELIPDIIISDIMMPKVSGLGLCETLKKDERTSHIPIILLTAKTEEEAQYRGLETGADDYIVKPFNSKLLETRVRNLVASRIQLRERYSQEVILKPKNIAISRVDEKFIEKVQAVMDQYLTNPDFSAEDFSSKVGMSRMQLHRKLKALIGLSTSELIRNERLKMAALLLQESDVQVAEICYQVGFNNPSYFAKCFKETYGCLPSEYSQK